MKKISAILLIAIFLFNLFGYRILFNYAQQKADLQLEASLDNSSYNEAELITIKVPLNLPYQNDRQDFERVNGEISYQGKIYKYVKRKMVNGELVLKCLPNENKMRLQSAKDDFFKNANDLVQNNQSKKSDHSKSFSFKNTIGDYLSNPNQFEAALFAEDRLVFANPPVFYLSSLHRLSPEQPPDFFNAVA